MEVTLGIILYSFEWSIFFCLSSCLLLNNLKHLSLPITNKQVKGCYVCMQVYVRVRACVCVYLCSIWSHGAVSHQHVTVKRSVKSMLMMLFDSSLLKMKLWALQLNFLLCLMMSSWCNNVQISCCFSIRFASLTAILRPESLDTNPSLGTGAELQYRK